MMYCLRVMLLRMEKKEKKKKFTFCLYKRDVRIHMNANGKTRIFIISKQESYYHFGENKNMYFCLKD